MTTLRIALHTRMARGQEKILKLLQQTNKLHKIPTADAQQQQQLQFAIL